MSNHAACAFGSGRAKGRRRCGPLVGSRGAARSAHVAVRQPQGAVPRCSTKSQPGATAAMSSLSFSKVGQDSPRS